MSGQGVKKTSAKDSAGLQALEAEATGAGLIEVEFRGETLRVDPDDLDDYELMSQLTKGLPDFALEVFVPDEEARGRLIDSCEKNRRGHPKLSSVVGMVSDIMQAVGAAK